MSEDARSKAGTWCAVPLHNGDMVPVIIARSNGKGVCFGYFFRPRGSSIPTAGDVDVLSPDDAILTGRFGDLGVINGDWPIIKQTSGFDSEEWPMPKFVRYEDTAGRTYHVIYDDDDPSEMIGEERVQPGVDEQGPRDALMGAKFVEIKLGRLVN